METAFLEFGIEARIISIQGPKVDESSDFIEFPIQVKEERIVKLKED